MRGHLFRESLAALPAAPDRPLFRALRRLRHARGLRSGHRRRGEGARGPQQRIDHGPRPAHGFRGPAPAVRGRGALSRPDCDAETDPGEPVDDADRRPRHRRRRNRGQWPGVLRFRGVRAGRTQSRQHQFLPAWRTGRGGRGAGRVPGAVLPGAGSARRDPGEPGRRGRRPARGGAARAGGAQRTDSLRRARHPGPLARDGQDQCRPRPQDEGLEPRDRGRATRRAGGRPGAGQDPGTHRVLRRQPHDGRICDRRLRRARARGPDQGRLPALQSRRSHARRRLRGIDGRRSRATSRACCAANDRCPTCC